MSPAVDSRSAYRCIKHGCDAGRGANTALAEVTVVLTGCSALDLMPDVLPTRFLDG